MRLVHVLGEAFEGYTPGAGWEDTKLGFGHFARWKRLAVVTDREWILHAVALFRWMVPGDVKTFPLSEERQAIGWAAG